MKTPHKPKSEINYRAWAYFAPDNNIQVRSIAPTKALARRFIGAFETYTYEDYEKKGYYLQKIIVNISPR